MHKQNGLVRRAVTSVRARILIGAAAVFIAASVAVSALPASTAAEPDPRCAEWDAAATRALAEVLPDQSLEWSLGDAIFKLRRARRNCREGWVALARSDYEAIMTGRYGRSR